MRRALARAMVRIAGLAALTGTIVHASAQPGEVAAAAECARLPPQAASQLPAPVDQWARLSCRPFGQVLVQNPGWLWRYTGSFTTEVKIAAIMGRAAAEAAGERYFRHFSLVTADGAAAQQLHARLVQQVSSYGSFAAQQSPRIAYTLVAINDLLDKISVHFLQPGEGELWGVVCAPDCQPENVFQIRRRGG